MNTSVSSPELGMAHQAQKADPGAKASPSTNAHAIHAVTGAVTGVALLVVVLRVFVRSVMLQGKTGPDDWVMIAAAVCSFTILICFTFEIKAGLGRHIQDINLIDMQTLLHWLFYHSIVGTVGTSLVKISIGLFLLRFIQDTWQKRVVIGMIIFLILFTISCAGTIAFACIPIAASWDFSLRATAHCYSSSTYTDIGLFNSAINIFTDLVFALLPAYIIWKLHINARTKITLIIVLSLGIFACAVAIYKTYLQSQFHLTPDWTRDDSFFIWGSIEFDVGILAASLPTLRPLLTSCVDSTKTLIKAYSSTRSSERKSISKHESAVNLEPMPSGRGVFKNKNITIVTRSRHSNDGSSQENILPMHGPGGLAVRQDYDTAWEEV